MEKKWFKSEEIAKYLGISLPFLIKNRKNGNVNDIIPFSKIGRKILYNIDDVNSYLSKKYLHS